MNETLKPRVFESLTPVEKIKAVLAVANEAIPKEGAFEWANIDYDALSDEDKTQVDQIFAENQDPGTYYVRNSEETELRYSLNSHDRALMKETIDLMSVRRRVASVIKGKVSRAREEIEAKRIAEKLKEALALQDELAQRFAAAHSADEYKDEIAISQELRQNITIKMDSNYFYILHMPSGIYMSCSAYTTPIKLGNILEEWVNSITNPTDSSTDSSTATT